MPNTKAAQIDRIFQMFHHVTRKPFMRCAFVLLLTILSVAFTTRSQTKVLTHYNDIGRTGQNTSETILNTLKCKRGSLQPSYLRFPYRDQVYAQPLYVPHVMIGGISHNVLIVATETDHVYAFDADTKGAALWEASMVDKATLALGLDEHPLAESHNDQLHGLTTADWDFQHASHQILSRESFMWKQKSTNNSSYFHRLHALGLTTSQRRISLAGADYRDGKWHGRRLSKWKAYI